MVKSTKELKCLVQDFRAMKLPGQAQMMHMGTAYLMDDLLRALEQFAQKLETMRKAIKDINPTVLTGQPSYDPATERISSLKLRLKAILGEKE